MNKTRLMLILSDSVVNPSGGLGERFRHLLPHLKSNFELLVTCQGEKGDWDGIETHGFFPEFQHEQALDFTEWLSYKAKQFRPEIVLCTDQQTIYPALIIARAFQAKYVVEFDLAWYSYKNFTEGLKPLSGEMRARSDRILFVEQKGSREADLVIACSTAYDRDLPWKTKRPVCVVPNGIDYNQFQKNVSKFDFPGNKRNNLVFIGRMNLQKGVQHLLEMTLPDDTALHFVGGPKAGDLFQPVSQLNGPDKFYIGYADGNKKISILQSADAIMFPSIHEPFGIVGLEAMAAGTPLITTRSNGIADYCEPNMCIETRAEPQSLTNAVEKLFSMSDDEVQKMVELAKEQAKRYTWSVAAEKMIKAIKEIV